MNNAIDRAINRQPFTKTIGFIRMVWSLMLFGSGVTMMMRWFMKRSTDDFEDQSRTVIMSLILSAMYLIEVMFIMEHSALRNPFKVLWNALLSLIWVISRNFLCIITVPSIAIAYIKIHTVYFREFPVQDSRETTYDFDLRINDYNEITRISAEFLEAANRVLVILAILFTLTMFANVMSNRCRFANVR